MKKIPGLLNFLLILVSLVVGGIIIIIIVRLERGLLGFILGGASIALFVFLNSSKRILALNYIF